MQRKGMEKQGGEKRFLPILIPVPLDFEGTTHLLRKDKKEKKPVVTAML